MSLRLFTAPHLPPLLEHLAETLGTAPLPPREMETIVVQSQGMRRWLTLQLADTFGCAGSLSLPFPAHFVRELGSRVAGDRTARDDRDPFSRDALAWRIDALLPTLTLGDARFAPLRAYLTGADERTRFGLAAQIASRLDDYQMFRADVLSDWERGIETPGDSHAAWQADLWRTLREQIDGDSPHLALRLRRTIEVLKGDAPNAVPSRVTVFGVSTLPPLFVELLGALAQHIPVTIYTASLDPDSPHPIAKAFGTQSREFLEALVRLGAQHTHLPARDRSSRRSSGGAILATLQDELANNAAGDTRLVLSTADVSLSVHDAHGQLRQVEILRDQLLAALADDPTLRPHDLLLLVPDAAEWAPLVDAVFGVSADDTPRIPYRIADRPLRRTEPAAEAMARLLALEGGRLERSEVLGFLSHPLVRQGAGLAEGEVEILESLIDRANVRWGYDAGAREALGLPRYEEASWRAGLDRLLLGVAVGRIDDDVLDLLPESGDTAGEAESIARLAEWIDDLAATLNGWRMQRTLPDWCDALIAALERFLVAEDGNDQQQLYAIASTIRRLGTLGDVAGYGEVVPFSVVRDWLEAQLDDDGFGGGFLMGGMTVAALKPMRSLPFRVIAVAGLDDGVFPRHDRRPAFDLLEKERRPGDRDLRTDDRQLFLDLLLAAGDRLILTYSGRAVSDNSPRAPSVVIDELLDHLDRRSSAAGRKVLVLSHPLQPFSPSYFAPGRDPRLFTFSRAHALAARASAGDDDADTPFFVPAGEKTGDEPSSVLEISLRDLADFWSNPSRYYCRRVLRFALPSDEEALSDEEVFTPGTMQKGGIRSRMLGAALSGTRDIDAERRRFLADGTLPPQSLGNAWHSMLSGEVDVVLEELPKGIKPGVVPFSVDGDGWRLKGRLDGVYGDARYVVRAGSVRPEHYVKAWVEHVAMHAARARGSDALPPTTVIIGRERDKAPRKTITAIDDAVSVLEQLVAAFRAGHKAPLPFFPQAAWAWLNAIVGKPTKGKKAGTAQSSEAKDPRAEAIAAFRKSSRFTMGGDGEDPYIALCFRGLDPMIDRWNDFERLASTLFDRWPRRGVDE